MRFEQQWDWYSLQHLREHTASMIALEHYVRSLPEFVFGICCFLGFLEVGILRDLPLSLFIVSKRLVAPASLLFFSFATYLRRVPVRVLFVHEKVDRTSQLKHYVRAGMLKRWATLVVFPFTNTASTAFLIVSLCSLLDHLILGLVRFGFSGVIICFCGTPPCNLVFEVSVLYIVKNVGDSWVRYEFRVNQRDLDFWTRRRLVTLTLNHRESWYSHCE